MKDPAPIASLVRKLGQRDTLSDDEILALQSMAGVVQSVPAGGDVVTEGEQPHFSTLLVSGFATRYNLLGNGERQITAIHVPGDFVDLHGFLLKPMDHSVGALSDCRILQVPHPIIRRITEEHPHLTRMLWLSTLIDGAIFRQWIVGMGRRSALERMAHLICELRTRLALVGLTDGHRFDFPITQIELADATGLSAVHVNRVLQQLRADSLITWHGQTVTILDYDALAALAEFDPAYLHLDRLDR